MKTENLLKNDYSRLVALFDLDGVILDTESQYTELWEGIGVDFLGRTGFGTLIKGQTLVNIFETHFTDKSQHEHINRRLKDFEKQMKLPFIKGKTWTTDAVHRETKANFEKRKADGCLSVEMECAAVQAMCDFRGLNAYFFFTSGDLLDAPKWDDRMKKNQIKNTQHDPGHFDIALELARYIAE